LHRVTERPFIICGK